ncbi:hypothetical protein [Ferruginibacter sp. SUN106]|uniref:hypothetical protein n=1 Tax=Ferruginibacter sp. SUN106 TaxID=2978348 RepID=UPI003D3656CA
MPLHLISTSTCVRRLFFSGTAEGGIEKIRFSDNFFKGEKVAPAQVRSPPAVEAKVTILKSL